MSIVTTEAFVLRTYSLAEAHKICVFLTRDMGKLRGVAHGARKMKSRFGSALEPFTQVALTFYRKEGRDLVSVSTCDILSSHFHRAARDVQTATAFSYMSELLMEFTPDNEANERLYRLVIATLEALEKGKELRWTIRYFETWLLRLAGFFPDVNHCALCGQLIPPGQSTFIASDGAPRCIACSAGRGLVMPPVLRETVFRMLSVHPAAFDGTAVGVEQTVNLGEINYQIIRHSLERDLRSYSLLKALGPV
ncbi:MAG TPA: DNA repair protein RecO [Blastocatellia bacterium]